MARQFNVQLVCIAGGERDNVGKKMTRCAQLPEGEEFQYWSNPAHLGGSKNSSVHGPEMGLKMIRRRQAKRADLAEDDGGS
jgi:hypothetical protein